MGEQRWDPIPGHAIYLPEFPGQAVMPDRLVEIDGRRYVRCEVHDLIPATHDCGATASDHLCLVAAHPNHEPGGDHDDQCTPHREWADNLLDRVKAVRALHQKDTDEHGVTSGGCMECGLGWPCPTYHFAAGYGEMHDCWDAQWCEHVGVPVDPAEAGVLDPTEPQGGE